MRDFFFVSGYAGFLKGCLLSAVLVSMTVSFVPVRYEANDDFGLIGHLSEQSGFKADPFHPTLSTGLSRLLPSLYRAYPDVPWHGLLIYSGAFLGVSLMFGVLFRSAQGWSLLFALPLLCILLFHVFAFASFTSAALMLEFGVLLCLMEWVVREECPAKKPALDAGVLTVGFLVGFFLRWRLVLYATAFGMPILFFLRKQQLRKAIPVLVAVGFVMIGDRALFQLMSSDEQKAYLEYNLLRSQFHDSARGNDHGDSTREALRKAGWSWEDYGFYKSWILYDDRLFNTQTLRTFIQENDPKKADSPFLRGWKALEKHFRMGRHYLLALVFATLCIVVYRAEDFLGSSKRHRLKIVLALTVIGAGLLYIMYSRFVPRVFVPLYAYFFGVCFLLSHRRSGPRSDEEKRPLRKATILVCAIVFCGLTCWQAVELGKTDIRILKGSKMEKEYIQKVLSVVENRNAGREPLLILMNPMSGLGVQYVHPLKEYSDFTDLRVFPAGWGVHSPRFSSILRDMGLPDGRAFLLWMVDNPKALLVLMTRSKMEAWRWKSMWESYFSRRIVPQRRARLVPVYDFRNANGAGLVFFSMRSAR